jgi:hypothetical protein
MAVVSLDTLNEHKSRMFIDFRNEQSDVMVKKLLLIIHVIE